MHNFSQSGRRHLNSLNLKGEDRNRTPPAQANLRQGLCLTEGFRQNLRVSQQVIFSPRRRVFSTLHLRQGAQRKPPAAISATKGLKKPASGGAGQGHGARSPFDTFSATSAIWGICFLQKTFVDDHLKKKKRLNRGGSFQSTMCRGSIRPSFPVKYSIARASSPN